MELAKTGASLQTFFYQDQPIDFEIIDNMVYCNATAMFKVNNARLDHWRGSETTRQYIEAVTRNSGIAENQLVITKRGGIGQQGTFIHERLIVNAARYISQDFAAWCDIKIADLLRTGKAEMTNTHYQVPQTYSQALLLAAKQAEIIENQQRLLTEVAPKVEVYEATMNAAGNISVQEAAKTLGIGPKQIFADLRNLGVFFRNNGHNMPKQSYIDRGWFEIKSTTFNKDGKDHIHPRIFVTPRGVGGLYNLLNR